MNQARFEEFLPVRREDSELRGWKELDFILITGDAYVDHPSFGAALIGRLLESKGYRIGIIPQPDWRGVEDFRRLGRPRLAFLITAGNLDSMVSNYSAAKRRRKRDVYAPGGRAGMRPDRAAIVYTSRAKQAYRGVPVVLGGLEASLRRLGHYDYWSDKVRRSILLDSKADLLVYGMGELAILEIARLLASETAVSDIVSVPGTAYRRSSLEELDRGSVELLPPFEIIENDKKAYAISFQIQYNNGDSFSAKTLAEPYAGFYVVQNPPGRPLETAEQDALYELPYVRDSHTMYGSRVPAAEEVRFSLTSSRGCFGGCSFCSLSFHQGRIIQARSHDSLLREARGLTRLSGFKGYIHDVGGPTANFRQPACRMQMKRGACTDRQCLHPEPCRDLQVSHEDYLSLLRKLRHLDGVRKVFVRSGIRYDYLLADPKSESILQELCQNHVSGQLKVAPEHASGDVLRLMGKPGWEIFRRFARLYAETNRRLGKRQYLVPYLLSSHPGSDLGSAVELAESLRDAGFAPEQVQDFYPTPGTVSTCMYWTGLDPRTMKAVKVTKDPHEKAMQRALIQYRDPRGYDLVREALTITGRTDLIGYSRSSLLKPRGRSMR